MTTRPSDSRQNAQKDASPILQRGGLMRGRDRMAMAAVRFGEKLRGGPRDEACREAETVHRHPGRSRVDGGPSVFATCSQGVRGRCCRASVGPNQPERHWSGTRSTTGARVRCALQSSRAALLARRDPGQSRQQFLRTRRPQPRQSHSNYVALIMQVMDAAPLQIASTAPTRPRPAIGS